ncbi:MAG: hypothetical protein ACRDOH_28295 [Streptosporangiaceae bacterium]
MNRRELERIERLEQNGTMGKRREELKAWFESNPHGTPDRAVKELGYSHADQMLVVADSIRIDMLRASDHASDPS